jgi:hypothetical protein
MFVCIYLYCLHEASCAVTFSSCAHEAWAMEEMSPVMLGNMRSLGLEWARLALHPLLIVYEFTCNAILLVQDNDEQQIQNMPLDNFPTIFVSHMNVSSITKVKILVTLSSNVLLLLLLFFFVMSKGIDQQK